MLVLPPAPLVNPVVPTLLAPPPDVAPVVGEPLVAVAPPTVFELLAEELVVAALAFEAVVTGDPVALDPVAVVGPTADEPPAVVDAPGSSELEHAVPSIASVQSVGAARR